MKAIMLLFSFTLIFFFTSNAQFHLGAKIGTNINKITGASFKEQFTFGYHIGGFAEIKLGKRFVLQPEVLFNQFNTDTADKFSQVYHISPGKVSTIKLSYLSIPLLLNYQVASFLSLQAGPQYGILINQNNNLLQNGKNAFKDGDFSLLGGAQLKFGGFRVYGRYQVGLSNLNDITNNDKWKNQSIQLGIGLAIF